MPTCARRCRKPSRARPGADPFGGSGRTALRQLAATGKDFSDTELKQALATMKKLEDDFLSTAGQAAEAASEKVRPELRRILAYRAADRHRHGQDGGDQHDRAGAALLGRFARRRDRRPGSRGRSRHTLRAACERHPGRHRRRAGETPAPTRNRTDAGDMLRVAFSTMRDLPRLHEITSVLIRHGLGDVVRRIGIASVLERAGQILNWGAIAESMRLEPAQRMRLALEELGPTFVKLGQVLATRVDLFPPDWIAEFEKLHSEVPPVPFEELLPELERTLGRSPFEVFGELETQAQGSASIAQVHRARLPDGTPVVLKIRRPGIRTKVDADLRLLGHLAELIDSEMPEARRYQPIADRRAVRAARSSASSISRSRRATSSASRTNFADDPYIVIPKVYPRVDERDAERAGAHRTAFRAPISRRSKRRARPQAARRARRGSGAEDDPGRWLFPRRPAPRQCVLPAGQPHRVDRLRHGRAPDARAPQPGDRPARRPRADGRGADARRAARLGRRRLRRRGEACRGRERAGVRVRRRAAQGHPHRRAPAPVSPRSSASTRSCCRPI